MGSPWSPTFSGDQGSALIELRLKETCAVWGLGFRVYIILTSNKCNYSQEEADRDDCC